MMDDIVFQVNGVKLVVENAISCLLFLCSLMNDQYLYSFIIPVVCLLTGWF